MFWSLYQCSGVLGNLAVFLLFQVSSRVDVKLDFDCPGDGHHQDGGEAADCRHLHWPLRPRAGGDPPVQTNTLASGGLGGQCQQPPEVTS